FHCSNATGAPGREQRVEERAAVLEPAIEPALGDAEALRENLDAHLLDAASADLLEAGVDPGAMPAVVAHSAQHFVIRYRIDTAGAIDTVPYRKAARAVAVNETKYSARSASVRRSDPPRSLR